MNITDFYPGKRCRIPAVYPPAIATAATASRMEEAVREADAEKWVSSFEGTENSCRDALARWDHAASQMEGAERHLGWVSHQCWRKIDYMADWNNQLPDLHNLDQGQILKAQEILQRVQEIRDARRAHDEASRIYWSAREQLIATYNGTM